MCSVKIYSIKATINRIVPKYVVTLFIHQEIFSVKIKIFHLNLSHRARDIEIVLSGYFFLKYSIKLAILIISHISSIANIQLHQYSVQKGFFQQIGKQLRLVTFYVLDLLPEATIFLNNNSSLVIAVMSKHLDCNQFHQKLRQIQVLWSNNKNLFFTIDCVRAVLKLQLLPFVIRFYVGFGIFLRFLLSESGMQLAGEGAGLQGKSPALL